MTQSVGIDYEATVVSRAIINRMRQFFEYTKKNLTKSCLSAKAAIATAVVNAGDVIDDSVCVKVSDRHIHQILNIPRSSAKWLFKKAKKRRSLIARGDRKGLIMLEKDKRRSKYKIDLIHCWNKWIESQHYCVSMPCKNESVFQRDIFRELTLNLRI